MSYISWGDQFSVNVPEIDEQHKTLFRMINELYAAIEAHRGNESLEKNMLDLLEYADKHFNAEEGYMKECGYPDYEDHCKEHNNLHQKTINLFLKFKKGEGVMPVDLMDFLKDWLIHHVLTVDMKYSLFMKGKGLI